MKKLITLIIVAGLALTIQAQDVTNKLGTSGSFYINDENDKEIIEVDATGTFHFKNEVSGSSTQFDLYNAGHNLKLNFYKANGTPTTPTTVALYNSLGIIFFHGYTGSGYQRGAEISAEVSGVVSGTTLPTDITFATQHTGSLTTRMIIKSDGIVNIAGLDNDAEGYVKVDADGNLFYSAAKEPLLIPINNDIQQLKEENAALKAEMVELRRMLELLMEEK